MNKSIFKTAVAVAVTAAAVFCTGCGEKDDEDGGKGNDISKYRLVTIGSQKWMAENLDYAISGSVCYNNDDANCAKYGRLYTWEAAKKACPSGWRLPTYEEWYTLADFVGGTETAGAKLKAASGWSGNGNGTDDFRFSALPGGIRSYYYDTFYNNYHDEFLDIGESGFWWAGEASAMYPDGAVLDEGNGIVIGDMLFGTVSLTNYWFSVRCVQN